MASPKVPSRSERRQAAGLPVRASTAELSQMGMLTFLSAERAEARNPQTGEMGPGVQVLVADSDGRKFTSFIGGVALVRELTELIDADGYPFTSRIGKSDPDKAAGRGNAWRLID
jgi:hypothetical protein